MRDYEKDLDIQEGMRHDEILMRYLEQTTVRIEKRFAELEQRLMANLAAPTQAGPYIPSDQDKIRDYLYLLFEAQKAGHEVHKEIDDSIKQYRKLLNI